jgi:hypothetical protein
LIAPFLKEVLDSILNPGKSVHHLVNKNGSINVGVMKWFVSRTDAILEHLLIQFILTSGIMARELQFKSFMYNLFIEGLHKWCNLGFILCAGKPGHQKYGLGEPCGVPLAIHLYDASICVLDGNYEANNNAPPSRD